jgi:TonB family protein
LFTYMYPISANNGSERGPVSVPEFQIARNQSEDFLRHFGFRESPFGVTPNPAFLFSSGMHLTALRSMIQSIESNLGFTVLLGDPGMGKTTLLLQLLTQYRDSARTAFIFQTQCKRYELLRYLASELELPVMKRDEVTLHRRLKEMLVDEARAGRKVLIFIDEAQNLQHSSLEAIRLLSDFETARAKLLHIILCGSAGLGEMLLTPELSQLAQRISTVCRLEPLSPKEVNSYITFRLRVAGCRVAESLFSPESLSEAAEQSQGVPRVVNSICYRALSLAHSIGERRVSAMLVRQAARDLDLSRSPSAINLSAAGPLPRTETPYEPAPLPQPIGERRASLDLAEWSPKTPEAVPEKEIQFRSATDSVEQPPSSRPQDKAIPGAPRETGTIAAASGTRRNSGWQVPVLGILRSKRSSFKNDRSTLVLAALILFVLGLWAGWYALRATSSAAGPGPAGANAIISSAQNQDRTSPLSDILYSPVVAGGPSQSLNSGNKTHTSTIQTLPQSLLPSKLRAQTANLTEAAPPVGLSNSSRIPNNLTLPLVTNSTPLPQPPRLSPMGESSPATGPTDATGPIDKEQASARQPIKIVQPKYPKFAELRRIEGNVLLELHIDARGKVQTVRTISGNSLLRAAAEEAAWQWQYPPFPGNQPSTSTVTRVRVTFKLNPESRR